jgi:nitrite reductase/ring-hydroxylating ferredoxin subunit
MKLNSEISKVLFLLLTLYFAITFSSCNKKDNVPYVPVDIFIQLNDPEFSALNSVGNYINITGGVNGIIIYRAAGEQFMAYDRTCTYRPSNNCRVSVDQSKNFAVCTECCNSSFLLIDGSVAQGPAEIPLKQYQTTFDGLIIHIFN